MFLSGLNAAPAITTVPDIEALAGHTYTYDVDAADPDGDTPRFSLSLAPAGMQIDADSGVIQWEPVAADIGTHTITVRAEDGRGGLSEQVFTLSAIQPPPNRPPVFTSLPAAEAIVGTSYIYDANADDADGDALTFATHEVPLIVENAGFEIPRLGSVRFPTVPPEWNVSGYGGIRRVNSRDYLGGASEGDNVAWSSGGCLSQVLDARLEANTSHRLEVAVGYGTSSVIGGYAVQLVAGGEILAEETSLNLAAGTFETSIVEFRVGAVHPLLGAPLEIRLVSDGDQVYFDDIRLSRSFDNARLDLSARNDRSHVWTCGMDSDKRSDRPASIGLSPRMTAAAEWRSKSSSSMCGGK